MDKHENKPIESRNQTKAKEKAGNRTTQRKRAAAHNQSERTEVRSSVRRWASDVYQKIPDKFWERGPSWGMVIFTAAILVVTAIYTDAAKQQVEATKAQSYEFHKEFVAAERPYVWIRFAPIALGGRRQIADRVDYIDYGKEPAFNVITDATIIVSVNGAKTAAYQWFATEKSDTTRAGTVLPPGGERGLLWKDFVAGPVPEATYRLLRKFDGTIYFVGRIFYQDAYGTHYHSDFCYYRLRTGANAWCDAHNGMR